MTVILTNLKYTVIAGIVLTVILIAVMSNLPGERFAVDHAWLTFILRWLHVV